MGKVLSAACTCHMGYVRKNNEDNLYFQGKILPEQNKGLKNVYSLEVPLEEIPCFGVFDGMGGESRGEEASYLAALTMQKKVKASENFLCAPSSFLEELVQEMNDAVCERMNGEKVGRMGSTAVMLYFDEGMVYQCNVGDSRAFRFRENEFVQISENHTDEEFLKRNGINRKPSLTQHLGIHPEEMSLEPHIVKCAIQEGDTFLLCSDGLTDMLTNLEICEILKGIPESRECVQKLLNEALARGGKDNVTIMVIRVTAGSDSGRVYPGKSSGDVGQGVWNRTGNEW